MAEVVLRTAFLLFHSSLHKGAEEEGGKLGLGWHSPLSAKSLKQQVQPSPQEVICW